MQDLLRSANAPGIQYIAVNAAGTLAEYHGGQADLASGRPMLASTPMMAYSMSKTITAAAVLQLVEAGRVALDDPLARHVDAQPYGREITVRQLLCHTAGVPNPLPLRWVHPAPAHAAFDERAALEGVLRRHPTLSSPPGSKYRYSNIGYWLLGRVIEEASGQPFTEYVSEGILRPLGLAPDDLGYAAGDRSQLASGYLEKYSWMNLLKRLVIDGNLIGGYHGAWLQIGSHYPNGPAFGGLVGTAAAFGAFLQDQLRDHSSLFSDRIRALFYEQQQTSAGSPIDMTPGWHIGARSTLGERCFFKEGGGGGFHCLMRLYPGRGVGTVVMTNATGIDVHALLESVDSHLELASN